MRTPRKNRTAFRPSLIDIRLEERVVLNGGAGSAAQVASFAAATNSEHAGLPDATRHLQRPIALKS